MLPHSNRNPTTTTRNSILETAQRSAYNNRMGTGQNITLGGKEQKIPIRFPAASCMTSEVFSFLIRFVGGASAALGYLTVLTDVVIMCRTCVCVCVSRWFSSRVR